MSGLVSDLTEARLRGIGLMNVNIKSNIRGFVLVDVLLGIIILTVSLLAIGGLYLQSSHAVAFADDRTVAMNWAKARIEELEANWHWRGQPGGDAPVVPRDAGNDQPPRTGFQRDTTVSLADVTEADVSKLLQRLDKSKSNSEVISTVNDQLILVTVTVTWHENGAKQTAQLRTYIERE